MEEKSQITKIIIKNSIKQNHLVTNARNVDQTNEQIFTNKTLKIKDISFIFLS
jgi:hypothetical protein